MDEFFTWEMLATFAGSTLATGIITQFTKGLFQKLPTQWLSYIIAVILLGLATAFTTGFTASNAALIFLNAVLVSMSSNGAFAAIQRVTTGKTK